MATTLEVPCPECRKRMKVPEEAAGKKVRCKGCGHVFRAEADGKAARVTAKTKPKPAAKPATKPKGKSADDDDGAAYGLTHDELGIRCPFCAAEMQDGDIVCLECGFNTDTRQKTTTKKVYERTFLDWLLWLFPGIMCVLSVVSLVLLIIWYFLKEPTEADNDDFLVWILFGRSIKLWVIIGALFAIVTCVRFAIKRFIFTPTPPEREKEDTRPLALILSIFFLGLLMLLATTGWFIVVLVGGEIPSPWYFAPLFAISLGMVGGALQYNV